MSNLIQSALNDTVAYLVRTVENDDFQETSNAGPKRYGVCSCVCVECSENIIHNILAYVFCITLTFIIVQRVIKLLGNKIVLPLIKK